RNLVIVESPAKAKTIERYLGPDYTVLASYGHVRDLPEKLGKDELGVDVEHDFAPVYEIVADRRKQVGAIERAARKADLVYLATDLDREGEAIAWHVSEAIGLDPNKARRVTFTADLVRIDGEKPDIADEATAHRHRDTLSGAHPIVTSVSVKPTSRNPAPPFTTSTLQQEASRKLGFSPKRTMSTAQRLYEGIATPEGQLGLITYMRTDSVALSRQALVDARSVIAGRFGERYTVPKGRVYKTKTRGAQEAHEAIRPTAFGRDPEARARVRPRGEGRR